MSHNPNTVKSQDELNETGRSSEVLLTTISELERTKKQLEIKHEQLEIATHALEKYANRDFEEYNPNIWDKGNVARKALICMKIEEMNK